MQTPGLIFGREPTLIISFIRLTLIAVMTFGFVLSEVQLFAVLAAVEAGLLLFNRSQVTPNATVKEKVEEASQGFLTSTK